ncbi:uncharacterized protein HKW66_Vig0037090 [Vigna angularis]|uniref:Uncharacterized protein n=1 Tax=Phaseolus angularis TaxID=3914 RepID=A0A8T0L9X5_PHAAN|nr:uncharacterized protein HKW66_Vig0037090 [Vigna angularis]
MLSKQSVEDVEGLLLAQEERLEKHKISESSLLSHNKSRSFTSNQRGGRSHGCNPRNSRFPNNNYRLLASWIAKGTLSERCSLEELGVEELDLEELDLKTQLEEVSLKDLNLTSAVPSTTLDTAVQPFHARQRFRRSPSLHPPPSRTRPVALDGMDELRVSYEGSTVDDDLVDG